jgi:thymidylate synthase
VTELTVRNGRDGYHEILQHVVCHGKISSPRGIKTLDAGEATIILESPYNALPLHTGRRVSRRIAAAEALQLIGGFSLPRLLPPAFKRFQEDDGSFWGAYGVRIGDQLAHVVRKIQADRDTRQAVITLWDPGLDNVEPVKKDHPCTVALGFRIQHDQLKLRVLMRSSDAWLGIPYDLWQFTQLQLTVANLLQVEPGPYIHTTWSLHIYDEHVPLVDRVTVATIAGFQPSGLDNSSTILTSLPARTVKTLQFRAQAIAMGYTLSDFTESERWYSDAIK